MAAALTPEVPRLLWQRAADGSYVAAGDGWSIDRHPAARSRQGKTPDWRAKWWLHPRQDDGSPSDDPDLHETCPLVTAASWTALHRHPEVLRYADVLAAGWSDRCWRIPNGRPLSERVMGCGDARAPLSALMGEPVLVHPQLLLNAVLETEQALSRAHEAEEALRAAGLPLPVPRRGAVVG